MPANKYQNKSDLLQTLSKTKLVSELLSYCNHKLTYQAFYIYLLKLTWALWSRKQKHFPQLAKNTHTCEYWGQLCHRSYIHTLRPVGQGKCSPSIQFSLRSRITLQCLTLQRYVSERQRIKVNVVNRRTRRRAVVALLRKYGYR